MRLISPIVLVGTLTFTAGVLVGGFSVYLYSQLIVPGKQIRNLIILQYWEAVLRDLHEASGQYPASLQAAAEQYHRLWPNRDDPAQSLLDNWHTPLHYLSNGHSFVLASFGSDHQCDVADLNTYQSSFWTDSSPCLNPRADTVLTDLGYLRACGK